MTHHNSALAPAAGQDDGSPSWMKAVTMLQDASPIVVPQGASAMTVLVEWEPGAPVRRRLPRLPAPVEHR